MSRLRVHHFECVDSTNDVLRAMVDAPELTCVTADQQTSGRGRRSRRWLSTPRDGLYLSVLLRPHLNPAELPALGLMSAVVVAETLFAWGVTGVDIKWPNDVLIGSRKVAGILADATGVAADQRVIVGIGVNLNHRSFPMELSETAISVGMVTGRRTDVIEFQDALLNRFQDWYKRICAEGLSDMIHRYEALSSYAKGRKVSVTIDDQRIEGETAGVTLAGALRLRMDNGELKTLVVGEVASVRTYANV